MPETKEYGHGLENEALGLLQAMKAIVGKEGKMSLEDANQLEDLLEKYKAIKETLNRLE